MMRSPSLTFRLALLFAAVSTTVLLAISSVIGYLVEDHFEMLDMVELSGKVTQIQHILAKKERDIAVPALQRRLDDALMDHHGLSATVYSSGGDKIFAMAEATFPQELLRATNANSVPARARPMTWSDGGRDYRGIAITAPAAPGLDTYTIAVALDLAHHREFMSAFWRILLAAVALGVVLSSLLGWLAARRGLAPIRAITNIARGISANRLDARIPIAQVPIEIQDMVLSFNEMLARLEESFKRLSDFSSDIAHELRTPVSNLMTQTQVAISRSRGAEEYREVLYSNLEEYDRLARIVADMLFIAKADHRLLTLRCEAIDAATEIDQLIEFYQALAEEQGVRILRQGTSQVIGDALMFRRAVSNLLSNAIRHTPRGGTASVELAQSELGEAVICIKNTGDGIAAEHLPRLFDRFYRVDPARTRASDGAGLGLAIVKSIVETHGGTIMVTSTGGVTAFVMHLPAR